MNLREALQMTRVDGIDDGYRRGVEDAVRAIRQGRDDFSSGEDMGKIFNWILSVAEDRIRDLLRDADGGKLPVGHSAWEGGDRNHSVSREADDDAPPPQVDSGREAREKEITRLATIEECARIADSFTCGGCGMDGKAGEAIRALARERSGGRV